MEPPHKVGTHDLVAQHTHDNFHSSSGHPLKYERLAWHKWLFGIQSRRGYSHYATYWSDASSPSACRHCQVRHNMSVHGVVAHCSPTQPLVRAWIHSWPQPSLILSWRATAHQHDLRIVGRLAVPCSIYHVLRASFPGPRAARQAIGSYQRNVLVLADDIPPPPPNPTPSTLRTGDPSHVLYDPPPPCPFLLQAYGKAQFCTCHRAVSEQPPSGPSTLHRRQC